ncbi:MAG TPA: hypothetical protein VKB67_04740 [Rhizomicrobium sp.]|nr:hypothetical protein [Rhizomicrobium sp.]
MLIEWLLPDDAIAAIRAAEAKKTPFYGFDGAFIHEKTVQLSLADSWDYSGGTSWPAVEDPYRHAVQFIQERANEGLRFELVFADG